MGDIRASNIVSDSDKNIERLVRKLILQHNHQDAKEHRVVVAKYLTNDLDLDEAQNLIDQATHELDFVRTSANQIWYIQNEDLLLYIRDDSSMDLNILASQFSHLTPPSLRDKYDLPNPRH